MIPQGLCYYIQGFDIFKLFSEYIVAFNNINDKIIKIKNIFNKNDTLPSKERIMKLNKFQNLVIL